MDAPHLRPTVAPEHIVITPVLWLAFRRGGGALDFTWSARG